MPSDAMAGMIRRHDPHRDAVFLDETPDGAGRRFQLALQIAYIERRRLFDGLVGEAAFAGDNARRLGRPALANHAAAAILMPFAPFAKAAAHKGYDVEALGRMFGASFEQVAHRLTTLHRPGEDHPAFSFVRGDAAGNVSKRSNDAGFPSTAQGGGCPLWSLHHVWRAPGQVLTQWLELPDGRRFLSVARSVAAGGGAHGAARVERAVALVRAGEQAARLVYAATTPPGPTPIGITCTLWQRDACPARAAPPIGRRILPDDHHRGRAPFGFADDRARFGIRSAGGCVPVAGNEPGSRPVGLIMLCGTIMATQFEPHGDGFVYRKKGTGPALPVTRAERDGFVRAYGWSFLFHCAAYMLAVIAAAMLTETIFGVAGSDSAGGFVLMGAAMLLIAGLGILSLGHATYAPERALADRTPIAPARSPRADRRMALHRRSYGEIFGMTALFVVGIGWQARSEPVFALVVGSLFLAGGLWLAWLKYRGTRDAPRG